MPPYTPYKTLDDVKEAIDKFDECCLDLLDVLDKLKPAGIDPKSLNPLASEIHRSLQRIAPQARARIELTKDRKKDLSAHQYVLPQNWPYLCRRYEETIRYVEIANIPALFEVVPAERATLLHDTQVMMERAGTGKFRVQQMDDDCGMINRMHMLGPDNGGGEGSRSGDQDSENANDNAVHLTWAASGVPSHPGGRVRVEFVPYDQRTQPIVSLEVSDNKEVPRVVRMEVDGAGDANYEPHPSRATLIKQVVHAKTLKRQYDAMLLLASFHVSDLARHLGLDRKELKEFVQDGLDVWFDVELEGWGRDVAARGEMAARVEGMAGQEELAVQEEIVQKMDIGAGQADDLPPANFGPMPLKPTSLEDMLTKVALAQSLQERHAAQIELLNALAGDLVRYCALDGEIFGVMLRGWMRGILGSSSRDIPGSSSRSLLGSTSKAVEGISLPMGTKRRAAPMSVLRRRAGLPAGPLPALSSLPSSTLPQTRAMLNAHANVVSNVEMAAPATHSMGLAATSPVPAPATPAMPALVTPEVPTPATPAMPIPATSAMPAPTTPARPAPSTPAATTSSSSKKRKRASDVDDVVTTTPIRQLRSSSRVPPASLHASLPGPSTWPPELPVDGPSTPDDGLSTPVDTPSTPRKAERTPTAVSATPAQSFSTPVHSRSTPAKSRVIPARDRINTLRNRTVHTKTPPSPNEASSSIARTDAQDDHDGEPQPKRRRSARFHHPDTRPAVDVVGQTTNSHPPRRLPFTTTDRPPPTYQTRPRSASTGLSGVHSSAFLLTPASASPSSTTPSSTPRTSFVVPKSNSIPLINPPNHFITPPTHHLRARVPYPESRNPSDDDERTDDDVIYTAWASGQAHAAKPITTAPGQLGAGETETEADEPPRRLPTARIVGSSAPIVPPSSLQQQLTPLLFEFSRLLSVVPAFIGLLYNIYHMLYPPSHPGAPQRVDYFVSALWAILTGYQCLSLTTGLLTRWRIYYAPLSTLVRLLALQSICWPATHFTLVVLEHEKRPVITWAVIATTTCCSRSVQLWVTSNLWWEPKERMARGQGGKWHRWRGGQWGGRRWDWREVGLKCMFPAGVLYFVMAWAEQLRREFSGC
ncbi:hypothetical protein EV122DRAFT_293557 [Schizophyllum commune]